MSPLLEYTRRHVSRQDIRRYSLNDPGYLNYVEVWDRILETGKLPEANLFDYSEPLTTGLCGPVAAENDETDFRRYRVLLGSAGLFSRPEVLSVERLLSVLLEDALALTDVRLLQLLAERGDAVANVWPDETMNGTDLRFFRIWRFLLACVLPERQERLTELGTAALQPPQDVPDTENAEWTVDCFDWPTFLQCPGRPPRKRWRAWQKLVKHCLALAPDLVICGKVREVLAAEL